MPDKSLRDEAAELVTEAVRELRDSEVAEALRDLRAEVEKLRAERAAHSCHGHCCSHGHCNWGHCGCWITHSFTTMLPNVWVSPYQVTYGGTSTVTTTNTSGYVNAASGYNPALTTSYFSN